jgi:hypothetical protein
LYFVLRRRSDSRFGLFAFRRRWRRLWVRPFTLGALCTRMPQGLADTRMHRHFHRLQAPATESLDHPLALLFGLRVFYSGEVYRKLGIL